MTNNTDKPMEWEKEFYKELDNVEATEDNNGIALFGYKVTRDGGEKFTIVDWGGVKQFISQAIQAIREETLEEIKGRLEKLMQEEFAEKLGWNLETFTGSSSCPMCGTDPVLQRKLILDSLTNKNI